MSDFSDPRYFGEALGDLLAIAAGTGEEKFFSRLVACDGFIDKLAARVIKLQKDGVIQSQNFVPGETGFQIGYNGDAEFNDVVMDNAFIGGNSTFRGNIVSGPLYLSDEVPSSVTRSFDAGNGLFASNINVYPETSKVIGTYGILSFSYIHMDVINSRSKWSGVLVLRDENYNIILSIPSNPGFSYAGSVYVTITAKLSWSLYLSGSRTFKLYNLPTVIPGDSGTVWNDNGTLKIKT